MSTFNAPAPPTPAAQHETGKKRASRISLDYFKKNTLLERWKNWLSILLLVGAVVYAGYVLAADKKAVSRGPVADVHAAWDNDCQACHENFSGVSLSRLWGGHAAHGASDEKCMSCHLGYETVPGKPESRGAPHHASMKPESVASCGGCHRDHRGRNASLVRLADSDCTSCHGDLKAHMNGQPSYHKNEGHDYSKALAISNFASNHPAFDLPKKDPGHIKFNHALHMKAGQIEGHPMTLGKVKGTDPEAYRRYQDAPWQEKKDDGAAVVLDCASCHVLDPGEAANAHKAPLRASGAYMQPTSYANHCQACHPLSFDPTVTTVVKDASGAERRTALQIPHHLQPEAVDRFLAGAYFDAYAAGNEDLKKAVGKELADAPTRPLPGKLPLDTKEAAAVDKVVAERIATSKAFLFKDRVEKTQGYLYAGKSSCGECHSYDDPLKPKRVLPSNVPVVWQPHARFNHASHKALDCRACHEGAYAASETDVHDAQTVQDYPDKLLPQIDNCKQCHAPARHEGGKPVGGVRHDCTECHSYHHGDQPLQGPGARARDPRKLLTAEEFLRGGGTK